MGDWGGERPEEGGTFYDVTIQGSKWVGAYRLLPDRRTGWCPLQEVNTPQGSGARAGTTPRQPGQHGNRDNPAGAKREEPQAIQQEGRGSDGHILVVAPHQPDSPHFPWRQALARLRQRPVPYTPPVKQVAHPPPPSGVTEEAPIESGWGNQGGQAGGPGNDPSPNGSLFIRLRPKTTTDSLPPPQTPGGKV